MSTRRYDSPLRRQRAAETKDRIVTAGADLLHGFKSWNLRDLTVAAVAERAGVSPRTVYRHFANEQELRAAVLQQLVVESDVDLSKLRLDNFGETVLQVFGYLSSFAMSPRTTRDPAFAAVDEERRLAVVEAVAAEAPDWTDDERTRAAAVLDLLWSVPSYARLVAAWEFDGEDLTVTVNWLIDLVQQAIRDGRPPRLS
jgi:AcrR family transcriptional regulator